RVGEGGPEAAALDVLALDELVVFELFLEFALHAVPAHDGDFADLLVLDELEEVAVVDAAVGGERGGHNHADAHGGRDHQPDPAIRHDWTGTAPRCTLGWRSLTRCHETSSSALQGIPVARIANGRKRDYAEHRRFATLRSSVSHAFF